MRRVIVGISGASGAVIAPPMPAFYNDPQTIDDLVKHSVGRVLDSSGIDADLVKRWEGPKARLVMRPKRSRA